MNDDRAYQVLRLTGGLVFLLISIWKVWVTEYWVDRFMPGFAPAPWPTYIVWATAVFGILIALMMILDWKTDVAALSGFLLLFATQGLLFVSMREAIVGDFIRNIGLLAIYLSLWFMAQQRRPDAALVLNTTEEVETI